MNKYLKPIIYIVGAGGLLGMSLTLYVTFLFAFANNNHLIISIDDYNELWVEFFYLPIALICGMLFVWDAFKKMFSKARTENK